MSRTSVGLSSCGTPELGGGEAIWIMCFPERRKIRVLVVAGLGSRPVQVSLSSEEGEEGLEARVER